MNGPITLWYRKSHEDMVEFNHLETGHSEADAPTAKDAGQKRAWAGVVWLRKHAQLVDWTVIE